MATNRNWPSRSRELSLYASPEEIAAAIAALRMIWSDYGRQMKIAAKEAGPLARWPRENIYLYDRRFWAMSETEQELAHRVDRWREKRQADTATDPARPRRQASVSAWNFEGCHRVSSVKKGAKPVLALHHLVTASSVKKRLMRLLTFA